MPVAFLALFLYGTPPTDHQVNNVAIAYRNGSQCEIQVSRLSGTDLDGHPLWLRHDVAKKWAELRRDAKSNGVSIKINYAFRTAKQQRRLYNKWGSGRAAKPGYSKHQSGTAIDIKYNGKVLLWMRTNAHKYGFKELPGEPWHWFYSEDDHSCKRRKQ